MELEFQTLSMELNVGFICKDLSSPSTMARFCGVVLPRFVSIGIRNFHCISQLVMASFAGFHGTS
jgi:hypothetical protein